MSQCGQNESGLTWIGIEDEGIIMLNRIVAVGRVTSAPIKRLIQAVSPTQLLIMTGGRKRKTAVVLDSKHVVITALSLDKLKQRIEQASQSVVSC